MFRNRKSIPEEKKSISLTLKKPKSGAICKTIISTAQTIKGLIIIGQQDGDIQIWEHKLNRCLATFKMSKQIIKLYALDAEHLVIMTKEKNGYSIRVLNIENPSKPFLYKQSLITNSPDLAVLPHSQFAVVIGEQGKENIYIYNSQMTMQQDVKYLNSRWYYAIKGIVATPEGNLLIGVYTTVETVTMKDDSVDGSGLIFLLWNLKYKYLGTLDRHVEREIPTFCEAFRFLSKDIFYYKGNSSSPVIWNKSSEHKKYGPIDTQNRFSNPNEFAQFIDLIKVSNPQTVMPLTSDKFIIANADQLYVWNCGEGILSLEATYKIDTKNAILLSLNDGSLLTQYGILKVPCVEQHKKALLKQFPDVIASIILNYTGFFSVTQSTQALQNKDSMDLQNNTRQTSI